MNPFLSWCYCFSLTTSPSPINKEAFSLPNCSYWLLLHFLVIVLPNDLKWNRGNQQVSYQDAAILSRFIQFQCHGTQISFIQHHHSHFYRLTRVKISNSFHFCHPRVGTLSINHACYTFSLSARISFTASFIDNPNHHDVGALSFIFHSLTLQNSSLHCTHKEFQHIDI